MGGRNKVVLHLYLCLLANAFAEIWPPFGHLTPNNYIPPPVCKYEQEKVYEDILEEVCTTEDVENCSVKVVAEQESSTETVCEDVVETICDSSGDCAELDPESCERCDDNEPTCQPVFKMETKTECSYETQIDKKCFRMYEVTYVDDCQEIVQTQCKLFHNFLCDKVNRRKCTKVPKLSSERCRNVPRLKENCREMLVRRPAGKCRSQCGQSKGQSRSSNNCRNVNKKSCRQVPTQKLVEKSKNVCEKTPNRTCRTEKVKRLKLIPKKICTELKQSEEGAEEP